MPCPFAPGWPALCSPWTAEDGIHRIVPLMSAADLVEEGNALRHCVGGYYSQCRSGDTQILSIRDGQQHAATLELLLLGEPGSPLSLRVGQFRTFGNRPAPDHLHEVVRAFLEDVKTGRHAIASADITAYRKKMRRTGDHAWRSAPLPLDHARAVWPLYRSLLTRDAPDDFDTWCVQSGLNEVFDRLLLELCASNRNAASQSVSRGYAFLLPYFVGAALLAGDSKRRRA